MLESLHKIYIKIKKKGGRLNMLEGQNDLLIYKDKDGNIVVDAIYKDETLWLTQKGMAKVFAVDRTVITKHLKNIYLHILRKMEKHTKQIFII